MIDFRNVDKHFTDLHVLKGINLTIAEGEVVVICGPSGSGKSTLIRCVNQLETIDSGDILIDQISVSDPRLEGAILRRKIGFVFQQFNLYPHLTALENITLALRRVAGKQKEEANTIGLALLARVGLADKANHRPAMLSGGQQQRVAIARALALEPQILLFDEPTSALDPEMIGEVLSVIRSLAHQGITMMIVTHEMGFAREVADRVVFMDHGCILESAAPDVFFRQPEHPRSRSFLQQLLSPLHLANEPA